MKIGLIVNNGVVQKYELIEIENLINSSHEISYIFLEKKKIDKKNRVLKYLHSILNNKLFLLVILEQKISQILKAKNSYFSKLKSIQEKINIFEKFPNLSKKKIHYFESLRVENNQFGFNEEMLNIINTSCEIIVLLGYNKIIHKNYLNISKYGILSFHTSDINKYRGRPPGFNEFINDEIYGGVTLQLINSKIDMGKIVEQRKVNIEQCKSYDETLYRMMTLKNHILVKGLDKIEKNETLLDPNGEAKLYLNHESRKLSKVYKCLKKTIIKRYFQ